MDVFCCVRTCFHGNRRKTVPVKHYKDSNIQLDITHMGHEVVILKNGKRLCGSGGALATAPLVQSKSYFEVKLQQGGYWSIGLATRDTNLNLTKGGSDQHSWCLCSENIVRNSDKEIARVEGLTKNSFNSIISSQITHDRAKLIQDPLISQDDVGSTDDIALVFPNEGDTIGVTYDHVEINFYLNGKNLEVPILNVKGTVFPVLYVDDGAILDIILDNFTYGPPPGYDTIMIEQSLL